MALLFGFTLTGDDDWLRKSAAMRARMADASPLFERFGDSFQRAQRRQFSSQGVYGGAAWAPLAPRYARWKAKKYPGKGILEAEGTLRRSLTSKAAVLHVSRDFAAFGTNVPYYRFHSQGTSRMPAREPIGFPASLQASWRRRVEKWLTEGLESPVSVDVDWAIE